MFFLPFFFAKPLACIYADCWYRLLLDGQLSSFLQGIAVLNMSYGNRERRTCMVAIEGEIMQRSRRRHKSQEPRNMLHNLQMRTHDGGGRDTAPLGQLQCQLATNDLDIDPTSRIQLLFGGVIIRTTQQNHWRGQGSVAIQKMLWKIRQGRGSRTTWTIRL